MTARRIVTTEDIGAVVREARQRAGLTQRDLALAAGAGERFIVDLERGKDTARLGKVLEVLRALGVGVDLIAAPD